MHTSVCVKQINVMRILIEASGGLFDLTAHHHVVSLAQRCNTGITAKTKKMKSEIKRIQQKKAHDVANESDTCEGR